MITNTANLTMPSSSSIHIYRDQLSQDKHKSSTQDKPSVSIRHSEVKDTEGIHQLLSERQVIYWTSGLPFTPAATVQQPFAEPAAGHYTLATCSSDAIVGMVRLSVCSTMRLRHLAHLGSMAVRGDY